MRRISIPSVILLVISILAVPQICSAQQAQASLSLMDQLREIDRVMTADLELGENGQPKPHPAPNVIKNFAANPWSNPAPTVDDIKNAFASLNTPLGESQGAAGATPFAETAINGLTDFIVNRAKDEVSISFLIGLRDRINADPFLKIVFKETLIIASKLEASSAKQLIPALRAALIADLRALPDALLQGDCLAVEPLDPKCTIEALAVSIEKHLKTDAEKTELRNAITLFKQNKETVVVFTRSLRDLIKGVPALTAVSGYADLKPTVLPTAPQVRYSLITIGTVAREYRWAPIQTKSFLSDPVQRSRFLALLVRDLKISQTGELAGVNTWADIVKSNEARANDIVASLDVSVRAVETVRSSLSDANTNKSEAFGDIANAVVQIMGSGRPFLDPSAASQLDNIISKINHINKVQIAIASRDYVTAITDANLVLSDFGVDIPMPSGVMKSLTFAATLASAKTSEEASAAIEAAALPVLSYRVKRTRGDGEHGTWIGINSYVGGAFGAEHTTAAGGDQVGFGGLSIPVGIEFGTPLSTPVFKSFSVFVPLIDVGTVASFRFKKTDTDQSPASSRTYLA